MSKEEFNFKEARAQFPRHWDEQGWPAGNSHWRSRLHPQLRVVVSVRSETEIDGLVYWDGDLEGLSRLFTRDAGRRWNIAPNGLVYSPPGLDIDPYHQEDSYQRWRWRSNDDVLSVKFERAMFGGPDTWHYGQWENLPFFEPIEEPAPE